MISRTAVCTRPTFAAAEEVRPKMGSRADLPHARTRAKRCDVLHAAFAPLRSAEELRTKIASRARPTPHEPPGQSLWSVNPFFVTGQ